jgi:APA family basic amino acid/polyamine antiporter
MQGPGYLVISGMTTLQRSLNRRAAIAIVVGGIIGSGIFMKPALMAGQLQSPLLLLSVWIVAGIVTLFGALSNAEAAALFPQTGGQYIFFEKMYGKGFAFVYGWAAFAVFNTAGNASIAYICSQYIHYFIPLPQVPVSIEQSVSWHIPGVGTLYPLQQIGLKLLTAAIVLLFTYINYRSVRQGSRIQQVLTALKAMAILALIAGILGSATGNSAHFTETIPHAPQGWNLLHAYMAAIAGAFWAYDGWNNITFVAGEIREPQRNIPGSLLTGICFCILVYLLLNLAFLYVLPVTALAQSDFVASDAATIAWGAAGGDIIALTVILFVLGSCNANILATARVTYAMGKDNRWFAPAAKVHPTYQSPGNALWFNAAWAIVLIFSGSFDMLTEMLIFVSWFFYGMSALGVFILRHKLPDLNRPYRVWGYPWVPGLFVLFTGVFLASTLYTDINQYLHGQTAVINALLGTLITALGIPIYYWSRKPAAAGRADA